jgi:hypothetical protein
MSATASPFQHLNFDDGTPIFGGQPPPPAPPITLPEAVDLTPWTFADGDDTGSVFPVLTITLGSPFVQLLPGSLSDPNAAGYFVELLTGTGDFAASISQLGEVPADAKSVHLLTASWPNDFLHLTLNGQAIPLMAVQSQPGVTEVAGDVSAFAGQPATLKLEEFPDLSKLPFSPQTIAHIDDISFSAEAIPEPASVAGAVATLAMAQRRRSQ